LKVQAVLAYQRGDPEEIGRRVCADGDVCFPPACKLRYEITADQLVELEKQRVIEDSLDKFAVLDSPFQRQDVTREVRREIGVAQDAEARFDVSRCVSRRASSVSSAASSTASRSKAMLSATFRGIRPRRRRACSACGRARQRSMVRFQVMHAIIRLGARRLKPLPVRCRPPGKSQKLCDPRKHALYRSDVMIDFPLLPYTKPTVSFPDTAKTRMHIGFQPY